MTGRRAAWGPLAIVLGLSGLSACGSSRAAVVVAQVGAARITSANLARWTALEERAPGRGGGGHGAAQVGDGERAAQGRALEFLIAAERTLGEARALGVEASDTEARAQLALFKYDRLEGIAHARLPLEAQLKRYIGAGADAADQTWVMRLSLLQSQIGATLRRRAYRQIGPAQVERYYRRHVASLFVPMRSHFEILMTAKRSTAARARREIEAGEKFLGVARRVSVDPEAPHGLQALSPGEEERPFRAHIFAARPHQLIGPIHQAADFYVFRVLRVRPRRTRTLGETKGEIRQRLAGRLAVGTLSRELTKAWRARTTCHAPYVVPDCRQWVAQVGQQIITSEALDHWTIVEAAIDPRAGATALRERALGFLLSAERTLAEASALGMAAGEAEARRRTQLLQYEQLEGVAAPGLPEEGQLRSLLRSPNVAKPDQIRATQLSMLRARIEERLASRAAFAVTHAQVAAYYRAHRSRYFVPERRNIEIIETYEAAPARRARAEISAGRSFLAVARRVSVDPGAPGGLRLRFARSEGAKALSDAIFRAPTHELVGPLKVALYYLFEVLRVVPGHQQAVSFVQRPIRRRVAQVVATRVLSRAERRWARATRCAPGLLAPGCQIHTRRSK